MLCQDRARKKERNLFSHEWEGLVVQADIISDVTFGSLFFALVSVQLKFWQYDLKLTHPWAIARNVASGGRALAPVALLQLTGDNGIVGLGESAPSSRYQENVAGGLAFLAKVDARKLSFDDLGSEHALYRKP